MLMWMCVGVGVGGCVCVHARVYGRVHRCMYVCACPCPSSYPTTITTTKRARTHTHTTNNTNAQRTSPRYFCTNSEPTTEMKEAVVALATALAIIVLPVPVLIGWAQGGHEVMEADVGSEPQRRSSGGGGGFVGWLGVCVCEWVGGRIDGWVGGVKWVHTYEHSKTHEPT